MAQMSAAASAAPKHEAIVFGSNARIKLWQLQGIPLRLDVTFLLVPLFFYGIASANRLEDVWLTVAIGTLAIFFSVLLHELGHALTAKWHQVGVHEIVVGGFFGYARMKRQAVPRRILIRILAAGPFANLAIFLVLWMVLSSQYPVGLGLEGVTPAERGALGWHWATLRAIAFVNLAMFVFNLIPAFPLDGGKILALVLSCRLSERLCIRVVSGLSILVGLAMVLFGFGFSVFLAVFGGFVVLTNLNRLRQSRAAHQRS
ncbi:MAG: site-2 protease family protein [Kiloniellales bacterium]|nr:site-2 protease family protein [Kiloniellales bacterium]